MEFSVSDVLDLFAPRCDNINRLSALEAKVNAVKLSNELLKTAAVLCLTAAMALGASSASLTMGKAELKSSGQLAFGPDGILFVGDSANATVVALDSEDRTPVRSAGKIDIKGINQKIAALLGTAPDQILINDVAVNPISKKVYLSVSRGRGPDAAALILRVDGAGKITELTLDNIKHSMVSLPDAPASKVGAKGPNPRMETITHLAFIDGNVVVAGLSNEEFSSSLRSIPFPFQKAANGSSVEIYHGSHGRFETNAPVRTFVPFSLNNEPYILAAYTCTPLVKIPVSALKPGAKVKGVTIAELGNHNRPLDMVAYTKNGKDYILMANSSRGIMKLTATGLDSYQPITAQTEVTGVPYETIASFKGVQQLDKFDDANALMLIDNEGSLDLRTVPFP
jgi:hypothetical protein